MGVGMQLKDLIELLPTLVSSLSPPTHGTVEGLSIV
jgi:hypothetical protein